MLYYHKGGLFLESVRVRGLCDLGQVVFVPAYTGSLREWFQSYDNNVPNRSVYYISEKNVTDLFLVQIKLKSLGLFICKKLKTDFWGFSPT